MSTLTKNYPIKSILYTAVCLLIPTFLAAQNSSGCIDSSYHLRYRINQADFQLVKQVKLIDNGSILLGKSLDAADPSSVIVIKKDSLQQFKWSKKITPSAPFNQLFLMSVIEAGNKNIAIAGELIDNSATEYMYRLILSPAGIVIKEDIPSSPLLTSPQKGVHSVSKLSSDSLIFSYYSSDYMVGSANHDGLLIFTSDNTGNNGSASVFALPDQNWQTQFTETKLNGNKLQLFGHGTDFGCGSAVNSLGTFVSMQIDRPTQSIDHFKVYCLPKTFDGAFSQYSFNSIAHLQSRVFPLDNGGVVMVRPYAGREKTSPFRFTPILISYFDNNFNPLNSWYLQSNKLLPSPTTYDLLITPEGTQHFSFADYNSKQLYYAIADQANNFEIQKKMTFPPNFTIGNSFGTQILDQGKYTGYTFNSVAANQSFIDFVQIRKEDINESCFGVDTSFLSFIPASLNAVPSSPVIVQASTVTSQPLNFSHADYPFVREEICIKKIICDTIKFYPVPANCDLSQPVVVKAHKNPLCPGKVNFTFDHSAVTSFTQIDDTTIHLTFNKAYAGMVYAQPASCDQLKDSVKIVITTPQPPIDLGMDSIYCPGKTYILNAYNPLFQSYLWQDGSTDSIYNATSSGTYFVTATDYCGNLYSDTIRITKTDFRIEPRKEISICKNETVTLTVPSGHISYTWEPATDLSEISGFKVMFRPAVTTSYNVKAEVTAGCYLKDTIKINVEECPEYIRFPSAFTPNDDGRNDIFRPLVDGAMEKYELLIYDRMGQLVFRTTNKNEGWTGFYKGVRLQIGVFVWMCRYKFYNKPEKLLKGTISLVK